MRDIFQPEVPWGQKRPNGVTRAVISLCHRLSPKSRLSYSIIKTLRGPIKSGQPRAFDVRVRGVELRLVTKGNYCETTALFAPQFYDIEELDWLCEELADGGVFLDIGGNIGLYSLIIGGRLRDRIDTFVVEPDPELTRRMQFNAAHNGIRLHLSSVALSDYEGEGKMQVSSHQRGENYLADGVGDGTGLVQVTTLAVLCNELGIDAIRALKIDVEGHEHRILSAFFERTDHLLWPGAILIEHVHDDHGTARLLVDDYGYVEVARSARNVMLRRQESGVESP